MTTRKKLYFSVALCTVLISPVSFAANTGPAWAWDAGSISSNGNIVLKTINGQGTYSAVQNPTGNMVKINQTASTQPPTVIIKNVSANRWSMYYKDRVAGLP